MVELIRGLQAQRVRENLAAISEEIDAAVARSPLGRGLPGRERVEILAAVKYVASEELGTLAEAGIRLLGENRAQDLLEKASSHEGLFEWDFIGQLQSRKVKVILPHVRLIHSLASRSALRELERHRDLARPGIELLLEVNVAREEGKAGIAPEEIDAYIAAAPFPVTGLMTMPPFASDPEQSRRWFAALRELADAHGLARLSMGTSQDYLVAVQEGATIVRIGTKLYDQDVRRPS
jgi:pyridoxal phosphate enzyme (YggS family)